MKPKNKRRVVVVDSGPKPTVLEHKSAGPIKGKTLSRVILTETANVPAPVAHSQKTPMRPVSGIDAERRAKKLSPVAAAALEAAEGASKPKPKARVLEPVAAARGKGQKSGMPEKGSKGVEFPPIFVADEDMLFDSLFGETG